MVRGYQGDEDMSFGEVLKAARERAGLSQPGLAAKSGVPVGTIRDYEQGRRDPLLSTAVKLAAALGVSMDELTAVDLSAETSPAPRGRPRKTDAAAVKGKTRRKKGKE